jgi:hypothetical protein
MEEIENYLFNNFKNIFFPMWCENK